jgi:hypothetical protein
MSPKPSIVTDGATSRQAIAAIREYWQPIRFQRSA